MTTASHESHHHVARNIVVTVLSATIIALGTAIILHGRDLVELRTKVQNLEHRIDIISQRTEALRKND